MAFQRATLKGPRNTAMRRIHWGLTVGLQRKRLKGGCTGLSRPSLDLPRVLWVAWVADGPITVKSCVS